MLENKNIYKPDQESIAEAPHVDLPILTRKAIISFLLKYECSAMDELKTLKAIEACIAQPKDFLSYAMKLINHVIKNHKDVWHPNSEKRLKTVQGVKLLLIKVRNLEDLDKSDVLVQLAQADVYVCLADLANKDSKSIFNQNLSVSMLSMEVFDKLLARFSEIEKIKPIRDDDLCLVLMHALNKFRDIMHQHCQKDDTIA
jgi:hypothetical protein